MEKDGAKCGKGVSAFQHAAILHGGVTEFTVVTPLFEVAVRMGVTRGFEDMTIAEWSWSAMDLFCYSEAQLFAVACPSRV